jgi:predicted alpha/beta superfamily hydrolase
MASFGSRPGVDNDHSPLADSEVHYLSSTHVGEEFKIFVGHCLADSDQPAGVLYLSDANGLCGAAIDLIRGMQVAAQLPPLLVVGIGHRAGGIAETLPVRRRDLTPSEDPILGAPDTEPSTIGGNTKTLACIRHELMPWVGSRFEIDPHDTTYFGHSLGASSGPGCCSPCRRRSSARSSPAPRAVGQVRGVRVRRGRRRAPR